MHCRPPLHLYAGWMVLLLHDSADHKIHNKKCKSQRQSFLAEEVQLWNELAEEMRQIQLEHLWETMKTIPLLHHKRDDIHSITSPPHVKKGDLFNPKEDKNQSYPNLAFADTQPLLFFSRMRNSQILYLCDNQKDKLSGSSV